MPNGSATSLMRPVLLRSSLHLSLQETQAGSLRRASDVVEVFFAYNSFHERLLARARRVPIRAAGEILEIPVLSAGDIVIVKMSLNRGND